MTCWHQFTQDPKCMHQFCTFMGHCLYQNHHCIWHWFWNKHATSCSFQHPSIAALLPFWIVYKNDTISSVLARPLISICGIGTGQYCYYIATDIFLAATVGIGSISSCLPSGSYISCDNQTMMMSLLPWFQKLAGTTLVPSTLSRIFQYCHLFKLWHLSQV